MNSVKRCDWCRNDSIILELSVRGKTQEEFRVTFVWFKSNDRKSMPVVQLYYECYLLQIQNLWLSHAAQLRWIRNKKNNSRLEFDLERMILWRNMKEVTDDRWLRCWKQRPMVPARTSYGAFTSFIASHLISYDLNWTVEPVQFSSAQIRWDETSGVIAAQLASRSCWRPAAKPPPGTGTSRPDQSTQSAGVRRTPSFFRAPASPESRTNGAGNRPPSGDGMMPRAGGTGCWSCWDNWRCWRNDAS